MRPKSLNAIDRIVVNNSCGGSVIVLSEGFSLI